LNFCTLLVGVYGTDIQRVQIIKGWVDASGETHEQVFDIDGDKNNGATVDSNTCAALAAGCSGRAPSGKTRSSGPIRMRSTTCVCWKIPVAAGAACMPGSGSESLFAAV
jgi:hypothetical protein